MKSKQVEIDKTNPFVNCKLGREKYADVLTSIIEATPSGFVMSVDGCWGTGKSTFMRMWKQKLENSGYKTALFNAWENDFISDPTVAVLAEIKNILGDDENIQGIIDKVYRVTAKTIPSMAKAALKIMGLEAVGDIASDIAKASLEEFDNEIKDYAEKKNSLDIIREELIQFIKSKCGDNPFVFIVDELDRCRPDYAVEVLEKIKHFFTVDGIVFVLSIDKEQLSNSIRGCYGSDLINAPEYLRRFIDLEYTLPIPDYKNFAVYLYSIYEIDQFYDSTKRRISSPKESLSEFIALLSIEYSITLRQMEKMFAHMRIVTRMFNYDHYACPDVVIYLIFMKQFNKELYYELIEHSLDLNTLTSKVELSLKSCFKSASNYGPCLASILMGRILLFYNEYSKKTILKYFKVVDGKDQLSFDINYADEEYLTYTLENRSGFGGNILHYTDKIDLLDNLRLS